MPDNSTNTCPECGGQLAMDSEYGETVCSDCGLVVEEDEINHRDDFTIPNSDDISPADIQPHADLSGADLSGASLTDTDLPEDFNPDR